MSQNIGYIRVSTAEQSSERQLNSIELDKKFIDTISGTCKNRPALDECISYVREGDILFVDSIDRLARNLMNLQDTIKVIVDKGVTVKFLKENLTFSNMSDPMANLTLHLMGAFAEFERSIMLSRQKEGIALAKQAGKHLGRPPKLTKKDEKEVKSLKKEGISIRQIAFKLNISRASVYKLLAL